MIDFGGAFQKGDLENIATATNTHRLSVMFLGAERPVQVLARSLDNIEQRIEWLTGSRVVSVETRLPTGGTISQELADISAVRWAGLVTNYVVPPSLPIGVPAHSSPMPRPSTLRSADLAGRRSCAIAGGGGLSSQGSGE
jgi:hypothetical protein